MRFIRALAFLVSAAVPTIALVSPVEQQQVLTSDTLIYEHVSHPVFPQYALRLKNPTLCDDSVKQYSGYLDIGQEKHLFFWFFESRSSPSTDPLVMWLSGGPGCSSSAGLLFELGPCQIARNAEDGTTFTENNKYSWNEAANVIFLDQPASVGYSYYSSNKTTPVMNTPAAAQDVYVFLQLFVRRFEEYASHPFHLAAESYGGHYAPHIASIVHRKNKELVQAPSSDLRRINLHSVMLGNSLTDPHIQMPSVVEYACDGPFAIFHPDSKPCRTIRSRAPVCERMIKACYALDTQATCTPATLYCWSALFSPLAEAKRNIYDVRMPCDQEENPLCYEEIPWVEDYMNRPDVRRALGADPSAPEFVACNNKTNILFMLQGDGMRDSASLLTPLVDEGVRLLVYVGNTDMLCNYMGVQRWVTNLPSTHKDAFGAAPLLPWYVSDRQAGVVQSAGRGAGNITYLNVFEAGHMVPHDQPEAALDMLTRWIHNVPFAE